MAELPVAELAGRAPEGPEAWLQSSVTISVSGLRFCHGVALLAIIHPHLPSSFNLVAFPAPSQCNSSMINPYRIYLRGGFIS